MERVGDWKAEEDGWERYRGGGVGERERDTSQEEREKMERQRRRYLNRERGKRGRAVGEETGQ